MPIRVDCKEGVWFKFISWEFLVCAQTVFGIFQNYGVIPVVTSACDGKHMDGSYHYTGLGWDFRVWGLDNPQRVADEIRIQLRDHDYHYDVILEKDHIHMEYDVNKTKVA